MRSWRPRRRETMHNACSNLPAPSRVHTHTRLVTSSNLMHCSMLLAITTRHPQHTQINTRTFHCRRHGCFMLQLLAPSGELHCRYCWFSCHIQSLLWGVSWFCMVTHIWSLWALTVFLACLIVGGAAWLYMVIYTINTYINGSSIQSIVCGVP